MKTDDLSRRALLQAIVATIAACQWAGRERGRAAHESHAAAQLAEFQAVFLEQHPGVASLTSAQQRDPRKSSGRCFAPRGEIQRPKDFGCSRLSMTFLPSGALRASS